jgi:1-pyrroline-5-carboxylate dehydrogenase
MNQFEPHFEPYRNEPYSDFSDPAVLERYRQTLREVRGQLGQDYPLHIGGEQLATNKWLRSLNPCQTDELIGRSAAGGKKHIDLAFKAAQDAYESWSRLPMIHRARLLVRLAAIMRRRKFELSAWETLEASKNYLEAEADVAEAIDFCEYYARMAMTLDGPLPTHDYPGEENTSFLIPMGVGVVIPPWNFPLAILAGMTAGPVVVGNTVITKPAPSTPIIAQKFMECVSEAGFPPGVINLLTGEDADLGDALVDDPRTRFINFTGSKAIGTRIYERASKVHEGQRWLKKVFVEMGGKDALIVDETADLALAAEAAVQSAFSFQGQKCSAMSRLIVVDDVYDEALERFIALTSKLTFGPAEENADVCAVINDKAYAKIKGYLETGKSEAKLALGGGTGPKEGYFIEPTIFADVPASARIAQEEIFGPVVAVIRAKDYDDALRIANDTPYALTGGIISKDRARLERARREFHVGNLYFNRKITGSLVGTQPFGGFNLSGNNAKAGGPDYLRLFMEMKTVSERF